MAWRHPELRLSERRNPFGGPIRGGIPHDIAHAQPNNGEGQLMLDPHTTGGLIPHGGIHRSITHDGRIQALHE
jgi:hypothetical protein